MYLYSYLCHNVHIFVQFNSFSLHFKVQFLPLLDLIYAVLPKYVAGVNFS